VDIGLIRGEKESEKEKECEKEKVMGREEKAVGRKGEERGIERHRKEI
jgi:hypothetical protein